MPIFELYSARIKRQKKSGSSDVYIYDQLPSHLRVQIQQILLDSIGYYHDYSSNEFRRVSCNNETWKYFHKILCREYGVHSLAHGGTAFNEIMETIATTKDISRILDIFEIAGRYLERVASDFEDYRRQELGIKQEASEALAELNFRFRVASVGYQYESGEILRLDSQYIHDEVVRPTLLLLTAPGFEGPQREFLEAHRHYRWGDNKDAVHWANKAFESTMKAVCDQLGWSFDAGARASDLIKILRKNHLWPDFLDGSFDQLIATLSSGLPQLRNNAGGHGEGAKATNTPGHIAAYALHLAAAKILLIAEAAQSKLKNK